MTNYFNKTFLAGTLFAALSVSACASDTAMSATDTRQALSSKTSVSLVVADIKSDTGYIMAALFNSNDTFLGPNPVRGERIAVKDGKASFDFKGLPAGEYAISLFHDVDADGKMAKNAFGIPTEPYGFSNDAPVRFGPPTWEAARFTVSTGTTSQTIRLK